MYKNIVWQLLKKLGNLTFAIFLLVIIALYSLIGTIIEQEKDVEYYQNHYFTHNKLFGQISGKWILYLQLDHVYTSGIFVFLLVSLALSLIICTFSIQLPTISYVRRWKFRKYYNQATICTSFNYKLISYSSIIYLLIKNNYIVFHQKKYIYAHKGLIGRLAPVCVHLSLIVLLVGFLGTFWCGFLVQEMIPIGEKFHLQNVVESGFLSHLPKKFLGQVADFEIDYYDNKDIKQFYTKLNILQGTDKIISKILCVNNPLSINGLLFYQTDWKVSGLRVKINNIVVQIPVQKLYNNSQNFWISNLFYDKNVQFFIIFSNIDNNILLYDQLGHLVYNTSINQSIFLNHINFKIIDVIKSTGLQIKKDPGTFLVYLGFFLLIISTIASYVTYSQIWIIMFPFNVYLSGFTNRADIYFEKELILFSKYFK